MKIVLMVGIQTRELSDLSHIPKTLIDHEFPLLGPTSFVLFSIFNHLTFHSIVGCKIKSLKRRSRKGMKIKIYLILLANQNVTLRGNFNVHKRGI